MRVLITFPRMARGGAERVIATVAGGLIERGHEVAVAAGDGPTRSLLEAGGIDWIPLPLAGAEDTRSVASLAGAFWGLGRASRSWRPDLVNAHNPKATANALALSLLPSGSSSPVVATFHAAHPREIGRSVAILRRASRVTCVSEDVGERLAEAGLPRSRLSVIPNGIAVEPSSAPARQAVRDRYELGTAPVVTIVGRLQPQKSHDLFLAAAAQVAVAREDVRFLVVGDGPLRGDIERQAVDLGLDGRTRFTGFVDDAPELIAASDLVVFSSRYEGLALAALEALALGVPVVATDTPGMRDLLSGGAGVIVDRTEEALAVAIGALLDDPGRRRDMGRLGRSLIDARFRIDDMVEGYERVFRDAVGV